MQSTPEDGGLHSGPDLLKAMLTSGSEPQYRNAKATSRTPCGTVYLVRRINRVGPYP